jgi:AP-3 complex subunit beta
MNFLSILAGKPEKPKEKTPVKGIPAKDADMFLANVGNQQIITLLKSENEDEQLKGMKILIAMQIRRKDVTGLVPYVVNMITNSFYVKRLSYFFLGSCSGASQHILMSINSFHKELKDAKVINRASSLRAFSSLRIDEILHIMTLALQRGVSDFSLYVRRSACYALIKLSEWDECDKSLILQMLSKLLSDSDAYVVGPALFSLNAIYPQKLDLLHGHYRRIVRSLTLLEFCFIPNALSVLKRYARVYLDVQFIEKNQKMNPDLKLLIDASEELLSFDSASIIIASAEVLLFFNQIKYYSKAIFALLNFKHVPNSLATLELSLLHQFSLKDPSLFTEISSYFYLNNSDSLDISLKKLEILSETTTEINASQVLKELQIYTRHERPEIAVAAVSTFGKICEKHENLYNPVTKHLVSLLKSKAPYIASQVIVVMRKLISQDADKNRKIIVHCAKNIENILHPPARACALWIIGKYYKVIPTLAVETLRKLAVSFAKEPGLVKHQILNSTCGVLAETNDPRLLNVLKFLIHSGSFDISYDVRDKCRLLNGFFVEKNVKSDLKTLFEQFNDDGLQVLKKDDFLPMSLSFLTGNRVKGYERYFEDLVDRESLEKTLTEDTSYLRDEEIAPTITVKPSTSYSSEDVQKNVAGTGLRTRVVVNNPESFQDFLKDEESEDYSEEGESEEEDESEDD